VTVELVLVSHTNSGKTTLARTLLGRDVGEVRDAPHVTELADAHLLLESRAGDRLMLWDTPGFGDSSRLVQRLRLADNPIGWLLREVWDRHRNRPFWCSQQAVRAARASSDVILYLVNAADPPRDAGYVAAEIQVLQWIDKPVLVLLNQAAPATRRRNGAKSCKQHMVAPDLRCADARRLARLGAGRDPADAGHAPDNRKASRFSRLQAAPRNIERSR
jgi:predicted GTPase